MPAKISNVDDWMKDDLKESPSAESPKTVEKPKESSLPFPKSKPVKLESQNLGTKEARKLGNFVPSKEATYKPNLEAREEGSTVASNTEIYLDQLEAINLLIFLRSKKGKKTLTKKQLIMDAIDEKLIKEFKNINGQ